MHKVWWWFSKTVMVVFILAMNLNAFAHGDDDHSAAPPVMNQVVAPRAIATSEDFELVAILKRAQSQTHAQAQTPTQLLIYIDQFSTNEAVIHAMLEVEGNGLKAIAKEIEDGVYLVDLPKNFSNKYALNFTITTEESSDLLSAILDSTNMIGEQEHEHESASHSIDIWKILRWLGALLILVGLVYWGLKRKKSSSTSYEG